MKKCLAIVACCVAMGLSSADAAKQSIEPIPEGAIISHAPCDSCAPTCQMCVRVKYKDHDEMSPCAVPKIVHVQDPCWEPDPCNCCGPPMVGVKICVPPCGCERVKCNKSGTRIRYDYGKYAVDVRVKNGYIEVDYQD